jgi:hypothetical protein
VVAKKNPRKPLKNPVKKAPKNLARKAENIK